jgi:hypothetical protein
MTSIRGGIHKRKRLVLTLRFTAEDAVPLRGNRVCPDY